MATEDLLINNGCDRQTVEAVGEGLPQLYVVPPLTCWWEEKQLFGRTLNIEICEILSSCACCITFEKEHNPGCKQQRKACDFMPALLDHAPQPEAWCTERLSVCLFK